MTKRGRPKGYRESSALTCCLRIGGLYRKFARERIEAAARRIAKTNPELDYQDCVARGLGVSRRHARRFVKLAAIPDSEPGDVD